MKSFISLVVPFLCVTLQQQLSSCQQQYTQGQVPTTFRQGTFFPSRGTNALETEKAVCRPIEDQIDRDSVRFKSELVTNTNNKINFRSDDSRIMSSRMQSRLDTLADLYSSRMTILKAWSQFPDPELAGVNSSLHYEGRTVSVTLPRGNNNYDAFLKLAVQATFDWVYYERSDRVRLSVIPSNCVRNIDVVFILDRSGSVGRTNHRITLDFVRTAVSFFTIGSAFSRVGVVAYSSSSSIQFDLDDYSTLSSLQNAINRVPYTGGGTNTPAALDHARFLLTPSNRRGARPSSDGIPKIAILITDGRSNRGNLNNAISRIRNTDIQVYAVGIGNIDVRELRDIATDPDDDHVFILSNYLDAAGFVDILSATTCDTPAVIDPGDNVTTEGPGGGLNYFQTTCNIFSNKVLVELIDITGSSFLFASTQVSNPGPLTPNTVSNTTVGINRRTVTLTLPSNSKIVYVGVQGQSEITRFTILVWDQLFNPVDAFIDVIEGTPAGSTIYEVSRNLTSAASRNTYVYNLIEGTTNGPFDVDRNNGRVFIRSGSRIDFNTQQTYNLTVRAQNVNQMCQIARIRINIRVISNRITFRNVPPQSLSETTSVGFRIVQVVATGGIGPIQYSIVGGNSENRFRINSNNGRIFLNQALNYETTQSYSIRVRAISVGTSINGEVSVIINVRDVNEQPFFTTSCATRTSGCSYSIAENVASRILATIVADDPDLSTVANGRLVYQLSSNSIPFSIDSAGRLRTTRTLDRERQSSYIFTLTVRDSCSGCSLSVSTPIRVTVTDVNDNPPVFTSNPTTVEVSEDLPLNTAVAEYRATDADTGSNAVIAFTLTPNTVPFSLTSTGTLSLTGPIDYETTQSYSVVITASNPGTNLRASSSATIQILNINDNTPVITGEPYVATVAENSATGTVITTVTATDRDLGIHGEIRYFLLSGNFNNSFVLNYITGILTVAHNIDRETASSFRLVVAAQDRGTPRIRRDTTTLSITISDVNDNTPLFRPTSYSAVIREDIRSGQDVVQVLATDADQPGTPNSNITYTISSGNTGSSFRILENGQIQNVRLDYETTTSYSLVVEGRDNGLPVRSATATVSVIIVNINDNAPTLTGDQIVNISESATVGSTVAMFQADDADQMPVRIRILTGNSAGKFSIDSRSGTVRLVSSLDYEYITTYSLSIRASDGEYNTDSLLTVNILDENEFSPTFLGQSRFFILEERPGGTTVGTVVASDNDRNSVITYEFTDRNTAGEYFILDSTTGVITTSRILDREALTQVFSLPLSEVTLEVAASDSGSPSRQSLRNYTITLSDINDNTPVIMGEPCVASVQENSAIGSTVLTLSATDADLGGNGEIRFSITSGNLHNSFALNSVTGVLTINQNIDRETVSSFNLLVTVSDRGTPQVRRNTTTVNINVSDANDNGPIFRPETYSIQLREDLPVGQDVIQVLATDSDLPGTPNSNITYSIIRGNVGNAFRILNNGQIQINQRLDFETTPSYSLVIEGRDGGSPARSATATVMITVLNVNENPPTLTGDQSVNISESAPVGSTVAVFQAQDEDQMAITLSILSGNSERKFSINPTTGVITLASRLDYESTTSYSLTIRATDGEQNTDSSLTVNVVDENEFNPVFSGSSHFTAEEGILAGTVIGTIVATDGDHNDEIMYQFVGLDNPNENFILNSRTGVITARRLLDRENLTEIFVPPQSQTTIQVAASDNGSPSRQTFRAYIITLLDINDNTPVITGEPYVANVQENSASGTVVTTVTATDRDLGANGEILYAILSGNINHSFNINSAAGEISVNRNIDREMYSSFILNVSATDRGTPANRSSMTSIMVYVSDVNDNTPIFTQNSYFMQVRENLSVRKNVTRVLATDADEPDNPNSNITYTIVSGNIGNSFRILNDGQIIVNRRLDYETTQSYVLVVEGRDGGSPMRSNTTMVLINIINVNEYPPTLTGDQSVNISESAPISSTIAVFQGVDRDQMVVTISISSGNSGGKFSIDSQTGIITLASSLDYETTTSYSLVIRASDSVLHTDSLLTVNILDENEFSPVFYGEANFEIDEEMSAGSIVGTIRASDGDRNDEMIFEFVGQTVATDKFILNPRTGVIRTRRILDRENLTQVFIPPLSYITLQISATDNGSPPRQTIMDYRITLLDINDNRPIFSDMNYANQLRENLPSGQLVFSASATDTDLGTNAQITYSFTLTNNQGSSNPFQIDSATGTITTTMPLDCELQPFYLFSITATDGGSPPMSSNVTGNLSLIDENDNAPIFSQSIYFLTVPENLSPGRTVMTFTATDADKGLNGEVRYYVESRTNTYFIEGEEDVEFVIDALTGRLYTTNTFDYERDPQVNVTVYANDRGLPRRTSSILLVITVMNVDEATPFFKSSNCRTSITVSEDVPVGTVVGYCIATDEDSIAIGNQPPITYLLENQFFSINSTTGAITTKALLDRESGSSSIGLEVRATDLANKFTRRTIVVTISDINDNSPQFQNSPFHYHFKDSAVKENIKDFMSISAMDQDFGSNGEFNFEIARTIQISETESRVEVIAQDNGVPSLNSSTNVTVTFQSPCQLQRYTISSNNREGRLSAKLLCSVTVTSPSLLLTLGMSDTLTCIISRNTISEVQWLHNGTTVTNSELVQTNTSNVTLTVNDITFSSAGQYACKASSSAGSLQSIAKTFTIQVAPVITSRPTDTVAENGNTASFVCKAFAIPTPTVEWFIGTKYLRNGSILSIPMVNASHATVYTCGASNNAGTAMASARLIVFNKFHVVQIEVTNINNPSTDGSCHYFDPSLLKNTIQSITKQKVMVSSTSGSRLCELSPCSPSPCQNGGTCALKDVVGGYECTCRQGHTGVNCTRDVNECSQSPCGDNGVCTNTRGSFSCACNKNYTGRTCQFAKICSPSSCPRSGEVCIETFSGYECKVPNPDTSVVVTGPSVSAGELADHVQLYIDKALQAYATGSTTFRRKRQVSSSTLLNTTCQPNFVSLGGNRFILMWTSCPPDEMEPTSMQQQMLCSHLFDLNVVAECKPPNGDTMTQPTVAPLSPTNVKVNLVFVDENNKPIDADTSVKILQDKAIQEALASSGITLGNIVVPESQEQDTQSKTTSAGTIIGATVAVIVGLALLILIILLIIAFLTKKTESQKETQRKKREKAQQVIQLEDNVCTDASKNKVPDSSTSNDSDIKNEKEDCLSTIDHSASTDNLVKVCDLKDDGINTSEKIDCSIISNEQLCNGKDEDSHDPTQKSP